MSAEENVPMDDNVVAECDDGETTTREMAIRRCSEILKVLLSTCQQISSQNDQKRLRLDLERLFSDISDCQEECFEKLQLFKEGLELYTEWLRMATSVFSGYKNEGSARNEQCRNENGVVNLGEPGAGVELKQLIALAFNNRGYIKYLQVDFEGAIRDYTVALRYNSALACAYYNRGLVTYRLAFFEQALEDMTGATKLDPNSDTFREGLLKIQQALPVTSGHQLLCLESVCPLTDPDV